MTGSDAVLPAGYASTLREIEDRVRAAQFRAQRAVNSELVALYHAVGSKILVEQDRNGWGTSVVERLASDLRAAFPSMTGLSRRNVFYMQRFAKAWPGEEVPQPVAQLPWGHIRLLLDKLDEPGARDWYAAAAVENGWSRAVLQHQVMNRLMTREGAAPSNFGTHLAGPDSELAQQIARDPYVLDFLGLSHDAAERDLEQRIMDRLVETLRELGEGFAFVGRQKHFDVDGDDFYIDLLFFHTVQLRYVVVELKVGKFEPAFLGQLGFYVSLVDDRLRQPAHAPTVGILLCTDRNEAVVHYALRAASQPVAVATYTYDTLPPEEQRALPSAELIADAFTGIDVSDTDG